MPSRATIAARPQPAAGPGVMAYARTTPMPSTPGAGQIVSQPANVHRSMAGMVAGQGYGAAHNNMPVGVVNGNQVYSYGDQGSYGPGKEGNYLADPSKTTFFRGTTQAGALTTPGTDGRLGRNPNGSIPSHVAGGASGAGGIGVGGIGGGLGIGGIGTGGAGAAIGQQLQNDLNAANAANEARYQQALGVNQSGQANQLGKLDQSYGNIYNTISGNQTGQMGFLNGVLGQQQALIGGLGGTQHEEETRRLNSQLGSNAQSLTGRGLGNSTVVDSMAKGYQSESAFNQRAIDDALNQQKLGVLGQYGAQGGQVLANTGNQMVGAQTGYAGALQGNLAQNQAQQIGIIESKTDQGPNIQAYMNALQQAGSQGGAGAFGGGSYGGGGSQSNMGGNGFSLNNPDSGGGSGSSGTSQLQQYLQSILGGGAGGGGGNQSQSVNGAGYSGNQTGAGITSPLNIPFGGASAGNSAGGTGGGSPTPATDTGSDYGPAYGGGTSGSVAQAAAMIRQQMAQQGVDLSGYPDEQIVQMYA